jgi:hypothetical protein
VNHAEINQGLLCDRSLCSVYLTFDSLVQEAREGGLPGSAGFSTSIAKPEMTTTTADLRKMFGGPWMI